MGIRCTSKAAFVENEKTGFNSTKRAQIFNYILEHPGCSRGDIERGLPMKINCVTGRVNELLESGLIREEGCKHDSVSGRSVNCLMIVNVATPMDWDKGLIERRLEKTLHVEQVNAG